jgi:hypothetical protein
LLDEQVWVGSEVAFHGYEAFRSVAQPGILIQIGYARSQPKIIKEYVIDHEHLAIVLREASTVKRRFAGVLRQALRHEL